MRSRPASAGRRLSPWFSAAHRGRSPSSPKRHENLRVVDWAGLVSRNRGWLAGDGVHVPAAGYAARARAIAKQVERC